MLASLGVLLLTWTSPVVAQDQRANAPTDAERLFRDGLEQMKSGGHDVACPMLAESYRIDSLPGVLFTLAECEAAWKKPATALEHYESFLRLLTSMDLERRNTFRERRDIALAQVAALNVSAPELTIDVAPDSPAELRVRLKGWVVPLTAYGVGRKVDPGDYSITAEIGNEEVWRRHVKMMERSRARVEVRVALPRKAKPRVAAVAQPALESHQAQRTAAYVAGGVGLLGFACGFVAGGLALVQKGNIDQNCPNLVCNPEGRRALDSARTEAMIGTAGFAVGILGAATASVLWFAWPTDQSREAAQSASWWGGIRASANNTQLTIAGAI